MEKDVIFHFNKNTDIGTILGEIQKGFEQCLTIDGTKDSVTLLVHSYIDYQIEPQTIIWHRKTNTWWVCVHDKVERYLNDDGFYYIHNIDLNGAIELCNARDLTDCGFNSNTYNVRQFFERLISLSSFEYSFRFSDTTNYNFLNKNVDYVKTFENYSLLSAIREFLDGYNSCAKLSFETITIDTDILQIDSAVFDIIQRTGNASLESHDIDFFDQVKEIKTIDKNSFGACVVSNCQNVISTQAKTFPSNGSVGLSANEYEIKINQNESQDNTLLRLPTNVYKMNWLKLIATNVGITIEFGESQNPIRYIIFPLNYENNEESLATLDFKVNGDEAGCIYYDYMQGDVTQTQYEYVRDHINEIWQKAKEYHTITFYDGVEYNANGLGNGGTFTKPASVPYIPKFSPSVTGTDLDITILPKQVRDNLDRKGGYLIGIYWERGSNLIRGFNFLDRNHRVNWNYTDGYYNQGSNNALIYQDDENQILIVGRAVQGEPTGHLNFVYRYSTSETYDEIRQPALFKVNYIPMSDIKMKVDNQHNKLDIQLYNQNGKLVDNVALERLVNSYAKEISSDNITRYKNFYDYNDIPKVGSFVYKNNETYVINNISMTFKQNESDNDNTFGYFIECEFTMSKHISAKSLMVNPNSNIRDYLIPQQYNVKRIQLYRDYWELAYSYYDDANLDDAYVELQKIFPLSHTYRELDNFSTMIQIEYYEPIGGNTPQEASKYWYYQVECITISCGKQIIVVCDFNDNNIIGYSSMNRKYLFDLSNLFNQNSMVNTPITYVDTKGKFKGISLLFLTKEQRSESDYKYYSDNSYNPPYDALISQCFIPSDLYDIALDNRHEFSIVESDYKKDATEVPVFEYCSQLSDSNDVLIGENALSQHPNMIYLYSYIVGENLNQNNVYDYQNVQHNTTETEYYYVENGVDIAFTTLNNKNVVSIKIYGDSRYYPNNGNFTNYLRRAFVDNKDYAIFRHAYNLKTQEHIVELMFIAKKIPHLGNNELILRTNHYKLK